MSSFDRSVREYMSSPVHSVNIDESAAEVGRHLAELRVSCLAVVGRDGKLAGVVSHTDLVQIGHIIARTTGRPSLLELPSACVGDVITTQVITVAPSATLVEAARLMNERNLHRLFVVEEERPVGVISSRDLMRAVIEDKVRRPVAEVMSTPASTAAPQDTIAVVTERLSRGRLTGVVVVEEGLPVGIFTQIEAVEARELPSETPVGEAMGYSLTSVPSGMPLFRAAALALGTRARRVLALDKGELCGVLTGLHFARAALG
jgi:CBS domain-containing protein